MRQTVLKEATGEGHFHPRDGDYFKPLMSGVEQNKGADGWE